MPALPGFGFGGKPRERGWGVSRIAAAFDPLMSESATTATARRAATGARCRREARRRLPRARRRHPREHARGAAAADPGPEDAAGTSSATGSGARGGGVLALQRTKPDSLTVGQRDSPAGLAAWIVEKFRTWSDCDGDVDRLLRPRHAADEPDVLLGARQRRERARIYYETRATRPGGSERGRVEVPVAYAAFPHEIFSPPRDWAESRYAIERWTEMPRGGHFAALEAPELLVDDVRAFFG